MLAKFKRRAQEKLRGRPGARFQEHYRRTRRDRAAHSGRRLVNLILALISLVIAILLVIFPGPAIPFFTLAGVLLAAESLVIARWMDQLEVKLRALWKWGKRRWDRLPHAVRVTMKLAAPCVSVACAYFTWKFFHR
jgi:hypothetical protein